MSDSSDGAPPDDPYVTPQIRENPRTPGEGGSCLRMFALWVLPAVVVPLIIFLFTQIQTQFWPFGVMVALGFLIWMGTVHAGPPVQDLWGITPLRWPKVLLYVVVQVVLIPLIWLALALGFCVVTQM